MQPCTDSQRAETAVLHRTNVLTPMALTGCLGGCSPSAAVLPPLPPILWPASPGLTQGMLFGASWEPSRESQWPQKGGTVGQARAGLSLLSEPLNQKGPRVLASASTAGNFQFLLGSCCVHVLPSTGTALTEIPAHAPFRSGIPRTPDSRPRTGL